MQKYICPICKEVFEKFRDKAVKTRLCSRSCYLVWAGSKNNPASKAWFKKEHAINVGRIISQETKDKLSKAHNKKSNQFGEKSAHWKGGVCVDKSGYILIHRPEHPYASKGYVREHRLVMERVMGRYLLPGEEIHHVNFKKSDNRPENLKFFATGAEHTAYHASLLRTRSIR